MLKKNVYSHKLRVLPVLKVHLTSKCFFRLNESLHLFETHCAYLSLLNPNLDFLQAVKVTKSGHHLLQDQASKGYGSIPGLTSQASLHASLQRLTTMQISLWRQTRNRPMPLSSSDVEQMMVTFTYKKSKFSLQRRSAFRTGVKIHLSEKSSLGLGAH